MKNVGLFCIITCVALTVMSCSGGKDRKPLRTDTPTSGYAELAVDDCFAPIIDQEIDIYEYMYPDAAFVPRYMGEGEAINMLLNDSIRLVVAARDLTESEKEIVRSRKLTPRSRKIAIDGIALIINKENRDSLISVSALKKIMTGEISSWKELNPQSKYNDISVVFDNPSSSTVRFIQDSINRGEPLGERLRAQNGNEAVLDYVSKTPNAMGVIGVNWISNPNDTTNLSFIDNVTVMSVSRSEAPTVSNSFQPFPAYLAIGEYPLRRDVYVILTDLRETLQAGFVNFIAGDRGQRIILKSGLVPATKPVRLMQFKENF